MLPILRNLRNVRIPPRARARSNRYADRQSDGSCTGRHPSGSRTLREARVRALAAQAALSGLPRDQTVPTCDAPVARDLRDQVRAGCGRQSEGRSQAVRPTTAAWFVLYKPPLKSSDRPCRAVCSATASGRAAAARPLADAGVTRRALRATHRSHCGSHRQDLAKLRHEPVMNPAIALVAAILFGLIIVLWLLLRPCWLAAQRLGDRCR